MISRSESDSAAAHMLLIRRMRVVFIIFFIEKNYVKKVEVNSENGGILVMYDKGYRQNVIDVIASIERSSLVKVEAKKTVSVQDIDNNFKHNLISCVAKDFAKWLCPHLSEW